MNSFNGLIPLCPFATCKGNCCCHFEIPNYYIHIQPKELLYARQNGYSTEHLHIVENYRGGHLATCDVKDKSACGQNCWKPMDCRYYPIYPITDDQGRLTHFHHDPLCPLTKNIDHLSDHIIALEHHLLAHFKDDPELPAFFAIDDICSFADPLPFSSFKKASD